MPFDFNHPKNILQNLLQKKLMWLEPGTLRVLFDFIIIA